MIRRLAHLCFITDNLAGMAEFYNKVLGLPIKFDFKNADGQLFGYYIDCGDSSFVEIFDRKLKAKQWGGDVKPLAMGNQYTHFCLEVTGLAELKTALKGRGAKVGEITMGMDGSKQAWLSDPDGNAIELMEYTAASTQIKPGHLKA